MKDLPFLTGSWKATALLGLLVGTASLVADGPEKEKTVRDSKQSADGSSSAVRREDMRYDGKDFEHWRRKLATELKTETRIEVLRALTAFGANGYGEEASIAILGLAKGYKLSLDGRPVTDDDELAVLQAAIKSLNRIGSPALTAVIAALEDKDIQIRSLATEMLLAFEYKEQPTLRAAARPAVLKAVKHENSDVRIAAVALLWQLGLEPEELVPIYLAAVSEKGKDAYVLRSIALNAIANLGPKARSAVSRLLEIAQNKDDPQRSGVFAALGAIGDAKATVPVILRLLREEDERVNRIITHAIGKDPNELALPGNDKLLPYEALALDELKTLQSFGAGSREAVPALIKMLSSRSFSIRKEIVKSLGAIGPEAKAAIPELTPLLEIDGFQDEVSQSLSKIDPRKYPVSRMEIMLSIPTVPALK